MSDPSLARLSIRDCPELSATFDLLFVRLVEAQEPLTRRRLCELLDIEAGALRQRLRRLETILEKLHPSLQLVIEKGRRGWQGREGAIYLRRR